jgi:hypothetical protein
VRYITNLVPARNMEVAKYKGITKPVFMLLQYLLNLQKKTVI